MDVSATPMQTPNSKGTTPTTSKFRSIYGRLKYRRHLFLIIAVAVCILLALYAVTVGSYEITFRESYENIWNWIVNKQPSDPTKYHISVEVRLPRILTAVIAGIGLAICGTAMQSLLKNPLADPYTMGISSGAGFGAALAIILGFEIVSGGGVVANAFVFAMIPAFVILLLSKFHRASPTMMVLCGIGMMYLFNAMTQLFMLMAHPEDMATVYQWMVGSISGTDFDDVAVMATVVLAGSVAIQCLSKQLNVMGIGDEAAKSLGINVDRQRMIIMLLLTLVASAVVSYTGIIGFIGLVSPHIARVFIGTDNRYLVPASALIGACVLILADIVSRQIVAPIILPVGVVTACIGGPAFIFLMVKSEKEAWT